MPPADTQYRFVPTNNAQYNTECDWPQTKCELKSSSPFGSKPETRTLMAEWSACEDAAKSVAQKAPAAIADIQLKMHDTITKAEQSLKTAQSYYNTFQGNTRSENSKKENSSRKSKRA